MSRTTAAFAVTSLLMAAGVALSPLSASASEGVSFLNADGSACDGQALLVKEQAPADRGIIALDLAKGEQSPNVPIANGYSFNSLGFNPADGQLYGTYRTETGGPGTGPAPAATNGTIWRISADGTYEQVALSGPGVVAPAASNNDLGALPFLNAPSYPIGDFDEDGHYWVAARTTGGGVTHTGPLYELAITPGTASTRPSAVVVNTFNPSVNVGESDFTYIPGTNAFWSVTDVPGSHLVSIDRSGVVTDYGVVANLPTAQYIGMYVDANGNMYAVQINTGNVYAINRTDAVDNGAPPVATLISGIGAIGNGDAAQCGAIEPLPGLQFGKVVDKAQSASGDTLTYTLTVANIGLVDLTDVPVHDILGAGATYVTGSARLDGAAGGTYTGPAPGTLDWTIPSLTRGSTATMTFQVTVDPSLDPRTIMNRMETEYPPGQVPPGTPSPKVDHPCADDPTQSCAPTTIPGTPAIAFGKVVDKATAASGDTLNYTIHVANTGGADATDVPVADTLPAGLTFVSADNGGANSGSAVNWTIPTLAAGGSVDLHVVATIDATTTAQTYVNRVVVTPPPGAPPATVDHPCADDPTQSCAPTVVDAVPAIAFGKVVDKATAASGDTLNYTIHVANTGGADATGLPVADTLPAGLTFVSADNGGANSGSAVNWTLPTLAAGDAIDLHVVATIDATTAAQTYVNRVVVTPPADSPPPVVDHPCADDPTQSCAPTVVAAVPAIAFGKVVDKATAASGDTLNYTIHVANTGGADATDVPVADMLPAGLTFVSADNGGTNSGRGVSWTIPTLAAGGSVDLHVVASIDATTAAQTYVNRVVVTPPAGSPPAVVDHPCTNDPTQSCASTTVPGIPPAPPTPSAADHATMAATGGELPVVLVVASAVLLVLGGALRLTVRRRRP